MKKKYLFVTDNVKVVMDTLDIKINDIRQYNDINEIAECFKPLPRNIIVSLYGLNKLMNKHGIYTKALEALVSKFDKRLAENLNFETDIERLSVGTVEDSVETTEELIMSIVSNCNNEVVVTDYSNTILITVNYQLVINTAMVDYNGTKRAILIATTNLLTYDNDLVDKALVQMFYT